MNSQSKKYFLKKFTGLISHSIRTYKYTKDDTYLTQEQRKFYEKNGYLIIRKLIDSNLLDECRQRFVDMCNKKVVNEKVQGVKDTYLKKQNLKGELVILKLNEVIHDDVIFKAITYKPLLDTVQNIIGANITCFHSIAINKPPNSLANVSRHILHQDLYFIPFRSNNNNIVATWTAMETVNTENGCLFVVPKSHKMKLLPHQNIPNEENQIFRGVVGFENSAVDLIMDKGDTVFFHPLLLHGSGPNLSKGFRKSLIATYCNSDTEIIDVDNDSEEQHPGRMKMTDIWFYQGDFKVYWRKKSKIVRGVSGQFYGTQL